MSSPIDETLVERVGRLERELGEVIGLLKDAKRGARRAYYILGGVALIGLLSMLTGRAANVVSHKTIIGQEFILTDDQGQRRAALDIRDHGPWFTFYNQDRSPAIQLGTSSSGMTAMQVNDAGGHLRLMIGHDADGDVGMTVFNASGRERLTVSNDKMNIAALRVYEDMKNQNGQLRVAVGSESQGETGVIILDEVGRRRIDLVSDKQDVASLKIRDQKGYATGSLPEPN